MAENQLIIGLKRWLQRSTLTHMIYSNPNDADWSLWTEDGFTKRGNTWRDRI